MEDCAAGLHSPLTGLKPLILSPGLALLLYKARKNEKALARKSLLQTPGPATRALIPKTPLLERNSNLLQEGIYRPQASPAQRLLLLLLRVRGLG